MFAMESYVTPILLSYVDKYVRDFRPADAQVSLWGGGVILHNLVLKTEVIQKEVPLPFTLVSGRILELFIQVPWTKIMSEPITVTIDTIECILSSEPPPEHEPSPPTTHRRSTLEEPEPPPGYMQGLIRRIVSNITLKVHHLIVKYAQDDIVLSLNVKHVSVDSTGSDWKPTFAVMDDKLPIIRKLVKLDDLTLCLDQCDNDGKVRYYQEPLLYRCQVEIRLLIRLVSAIVRRASHLQVQILCPRLPWGISTDQMLLLLKLIKQFKEQEKLHHKQTSSTKKNYSEKTMKQNLPSHVESNPQGGVVIVESSPTNLAQPSADTTPSETWSQWAWSWLPMTGSPTAPTLEISADEDTPVFSGPTPLQVSVHCEELSLALKIMEYDGNLRKRARSILKIDTRHLAVKSFILKPTKLKARLGIHSIKIESEGRCSCGHLDWNSGINKPTSFLWEKLVSTKDDGDSSKTLKIWKFPEQEFEKMTFDGAEIKEDEFTDIRPVKKTEVTEKEPSVPKPVPSSPKTEEAAKTEQKKEDIEQKKEFKLDQPRSKDKFWELLDPAIYIEFRHERSPPNIFINPYEDPPEDFEYSDWIEEFQLIVQQKKSLTFRVCTGLFHRVTALTSVLKQANTGSVGVPAPPRTLTVEECDALMDNLPQRRINVLFGDLTVRLYPWDHSLTEKPEKSPLVVNLNIIDGGIVLLAPMYAQRVCSAVCQMPNAPEHLQQATKTRITMNMPSIVASLYATANEKSKPCCRLDLEVVINDLMHKHLFPNPEIVTLNFIANLREASICGSTARLLACYYVIVSLATGKPSPELKITSITKDAIRDENAVALDLSLEECFSKGFITRNTISNVLKIGAIRVIAMQSTELPKSINFSRRSTIESISTAKEEEQENVQQAWIFSAPDIPSTTPYLRWAFQWCFTPLPNTIDYLGIWTEPMALCIDPLLVGWFAYRPKIKKKIETRPNIPLTKVISSTVYLNRRRTPPSSGRGPSRSGSGVEVHSRCRSTDSGSSEHKKPKSNKDQPQKEQELIKPEELLKWHDRLQHVLMTVEFGLVLVYVTVTTVSAISCSTMQNAIEEHAASGHKVLAISVGRWHIHSNILTKNLWEKVRYDQPSFIEPVPEHSTASTSKGPTKNEPSCTGESTTTKFNKPPSFPWKLKLADVSCYTLEVRVNTESGSYKGLRSRIKPHIVNRRTILEFVTTTVTGSFVTKNVKYTQYLKPPRPPKPESVQKKDEEEDSLKYFNTGPDFKPSSLKEFLRGPEGSRRIFDKMRHTEESKKEKESSEDSNRDYNEVQSKVLEGPLTSIGVNIYAETQPLRINLDGDQIVVLAVAIHCFKHFLHYLNKSPFVSPLNVSRRPQLSRTLYDVEETADSDVSTNRSADLVQIYKACTDVQDSPKLTKFLLFQWVINKMTTVIDLDLDKLVFQIEDAMFSVDFQNVYNQARIKMTSAFIKTYTRSGEDHEEWVPGPIGGRVLETREATSENDETVFLSVTVTKARISSLPLSWKEELHPKLLENSKSNQDFMWEIYATLAPLEILLENNVVRSLIFIANPLNPDFTCNLQKGNEIESQSVRSSICKDTVIFKDEHKNPEDWPYFYFIVGGLRVVAYSRNTSEDVDDAIILNMSRSSITPYPDNPICRRTISSNADTNVEGRQYEMMIKSVMLKTTRFDEFHAYEAGLLERKAGKDNPAALWSENTTPPELTPIIRPLDISCVFAPPNYSGSVLIGGPALELNLVSDCIIELSVEQLKLINKLTTHLYDVIISQHDLAESFISENTAEKGECNYAAVIEKFTVTLSSSEESDDEDNALRFISYARYKDQAEDSGIDMMSAGGSQFRQIPEETSGKSKSFVNFADSTSNLHTNPWDFLELFVTMGTIDVTVEAEDTGLPTILALRPPPGSRRGDDHYIGTKFRQDADLGTESSLRRNLVQSRKAQSCVKLFYVILDQPNMYYWRNRSTKTLQLSLFNLYVGLGASPHGSEWHTRLLNTAKGQPDRDTDIMPALATLKVVLPANVGEGSTATYFNNTRGLIDVNVERPLILEISQDKIRRIMVTHEFFESQFITKELVRDKIALSNAPKTPLLIAVKNNFKKHGIESATVRTNQIGVCGLEGIAGWDSASLQVAVEGRPDHLLARSLIAAAVIAVGPPDAPRKTVMLPLHVGTEFHAIWGSRIRADANSEPPKPSTKAHIEIDNLIFDIGPDDLSIISRLQNALTTALEKKNSSRRYQTQHAKITPSKVSAITKIHSTTTLGIETPPSTTLNTTTIPSTSTPNTTTTAGTKITSEKESPSHYINSGINTSSERESDHYYKDDLRSGAFKIIRGTQMPMPYQVVLHGTAVSWCYPHRRSITKLVAYPLPGQDAEVECVLECYNKIANCWEPHTYFAIPVFEEREITIYVPPPEGIVAKRWRYRLASMNTEKPTPHLFNSEMFIPRENPFQEEKFEPEEPEWKTLSVSAEELSGVLRVDSRYAPVLMPMFRFNLLLNRLEFHGFNTIVPISKELENVQGYYISKHLQRTHRTFNLMAHQTRMYGELCSPTGDLLVFKTQFSADILNCETRQMEKFIDKFNVQSGLSICPEPRKKYRTRFHATSIRLGLNAPRLRTLKVIILDFQNGIERALSTQRSLHVPLYNVKRYELDSLEAFEGRIGYWIYNRTAESFRVRQVGTDEDIPIAPGCRLAYSWCHPAAEKKVRLALNRPSAETYWSEPIDFNIMHTHVEIKQKEENSDSEDVVVLTIRNLNVRSMRCMHLIGRLTFANMLRFNLVYKIRLVQSNFLDKRKGLLTGEIPAETILPSLVCESSADMTMKIKFSNHNAAWSGDIPLKECPRKNYPWLVKVPAEGEMPYISVWCRITFARVSTCVLVAFWPLYSLYSHLSQDIDVLVSSELPPSELKKTDQEVSPTRTAPLLQAAQGRGAVTHILAPGTTSAKHKLSFQYRDLDCQVTREAVDLHYGMVDGTVFGPEPPIDFISEVLEELVSWQKFTRREGRGGWPYSIVTRHWRGTWHPALLQPRCDINVNYVSVRGGGGCSLQLVLSPVVLLCNASPITLTLRAHDAAPLCKVEPGVAISPPSSIISQPFFLSVELNRETFVSRQLELFTSDPGPYQELPPGKVAVDRPTNFAVQCKANQKVAFLTLYYEIQHHINIFGISSTFTIVNHLNNNVLVSAMTTLDDPCKIKSMAAQGFSVLEPTPQTSIIGVPLYKFHMRDRWQGSDESELNTYILLSVATANEGENAMEPISEPVPVQLTTDTAKRRAIALLDRSHKSIPVVVTQQKHEGRWLVRIADDPCPQYVVHNGTRHRIAIAEPNPEGEDAGISVIPDCYGIRWHCIVKPKTVLHYSTPTHCARHPTKEEHKQIVPTLTFSRIEGENEFTWSQPVVAADGELLLQLPSHKTTVKLSIRTAPYSTLVDIQPVKNTDIAASDVRRRIPVTPTAVGTEASPLSTDHVPTQESIRTTFSQYKIEAIKSQHTLFKDKEEKEKKEKTLKLSEETMQTENMNRIQSVGSLTEPTNMTKIEADKTLKEPPKEQPKKEPPTEDETEPFEVLTSKGENQTPFKGLAEDKLLKTSTPESKEDSSSKVASANAIVTLSDTRTSEARDESVPLEQSVLPQFTAPEESVATGEPSIKLGPSKVHVSRDSTDNSSKKSDIPVSLLASVKQPVKPLEPVKRIESGSLASIQRTPTPIMSRTDVKSIEPSSTVEPLTQAETPTPATKVSKEEIAYLQTGVKQVSPINQESSEHESRTSTDDPQTNSEERIWRTNGKDNELIVIRSSLIEDNTSFNISAAFLVSELLRGVIDSVVIEVSESSLHKPLFAAYLDRAAFFISSEPMRKDLTISVEDVQVDNLHHDSGNYDFAVVGTTRTSPYIPGICPGLWNMFLDQEAFAIKKETARVMVSVTYDMWDVVGYHFEELTEVDLRIGPLAVYLEDAFLKALEELYKKAVPPSRSTVESSNLDYKRALSEAITIQKPLVLRLLNIDPIDLELTLHTAIRMYIALDRSPLHLSAFKRENIMMSRERLAHCCTVHYLSAMILGAGWVVGGLELLGAPGAFAARVGNAQGGVKGIAAATAAGLVRSLSALARSLARNLDILAGDEEHAKRAAAARRRTPDSFISGLITGLANFAINILGAVGGLAHHPIGVATGETDSSTTALRRTVLGALTKPLSATADLVAYVGHGLLSQTGWDPIPEPRETWVPHETLTQGWRRDCVRWKFKFGFLMVSYGFSSLFKNAPVHLLIGNKFLAVIESDTENLLEMINFNHCHLRPCGGNIIEIEIKYPVKRSNKATNVPTRDNEDVAAAEMNATAMARVARYTGAEEQPGPGEVRLLQLIPATNEAYSLHAALATAIHANRTTHFHFH